MASSDDSSFTVFKQDGGSHQFYCRWSVEEDMLLAKAVSDHGPHKWTLISRFIPGRTAVQCSTRWFGALNPNVHKGRWSEHEDRALNEAVRYFLTVTKDSNLPWNRIAENIPYRTGIQCQARWTEALDPAVRKGRWHPNEDKLLNIAIAKYGCCWIRVASMIPTRTQRQCRTRWNQIHSQQLKTVSTKAANYKRANIISAPMKFEYDACKDFNELFSPLLFNNDNQFTNQLPMNNSKEYMSSYPASYSSTFSSDDQLSPSSSVEEFLAQYSKPPSTTVSKSSSFSSYLPLSLPEQQIIPNDCNSLLFPTDFDFLL